MYNATMSAGYFSEGRREGREEREGRRVGEEERKEIKGRGGERGGGEKRE